MIVNGKAIAKTIQDRLAMERDSYDYPLRLGIIYAGQDERIEQFMRIKERFGKAIGVELVIKRLPADCQTKDVLDMIDFCANALDSQNQPFYHGLLVQLPLPDQVDKKRVLDHLPIHLDCDVLSGRSYQRFLDGSLVFPPVAGAIKAIVKQHRVDLSDKTIAVVGQGNLVGKPVTDWLKSLGIEQMIIDKDSKATLNDLRNADVIISGTGQPHLIKPGMIKPDSVIFDAGTSSSKGAVAGDIDPACAEKASLASLVPGGIGPITVAILYQNFFWLLQDQSQ